MLNQSLESDKSLDPEQERQKLMIRRQRSIEESLQLNVKDHILKLDNQLAELKKELEHSKKHISNARMEVVTLKNHHQSGCDDLNTLVFNETNRLGVDLKRRSLEITNDFEFYDSQMITLKSDKDKLLDVAVVLDKRIQSCETDVGFRHVYD